MSSILLDRNSNTPPPIGYLLIDTEIGFLEHATSDQALFIRGQRLCAWAREFYGGRKIACKDVVSPISELLETYGGLTTRQAEIVCEKLGPKITVLEKLSALEILSACFPVELWAAIPSRKHAAEWLVWLDKTLGFEDVFLPIYATLTVEWGLIAPEFGEIYAIQNATAAREMLRKWLGAEITPFIERYGEFPIPMPDNWIELLDRSWRKEIVRTEGAFISEFLHLSTPWQFKQQVALASLDYFEKYPNTKTFTPERHSQMARFLSGKDRARLSMIVPVPTPGDVPDTPESVLAWFAKEYLPFREWQVAAKANDAYPRVLELGLQFAEWYLGFYPAALTSKQHLSFFRSKDLTKKVSGHVNLLVILDGLQALDAKFVMDTLLKSNGLQRLVMTENSFCFAPLPTVTDFGKGALVRGVQPTLMREIELLGEDISEQRNPLPKLQSAKLDSLFIWRIQDPDRTYHTKNKSSLLMADVEGELSTIAQKIRRISESLSPSIPLRIIITTDHGRFLGVSKRTIDVPQGMQAHGRAAWGSTSVTFDETGYKIDGELVYLSKDRFGLLDDDAAIILTDKAFRHERYDQEISTHGGLFPEEVIIPWMVFERNIARPDLTCVLSGEGGANLPGKLMVSIINPSSLDLTILRLKLNFPGNNDMDFDLNIEIDGFKKTEFEVDLSTWPSSEQLLRSKASIVLGLPSGEEFSVPVSLDELKVIELYTRDKSLLEGLDL